jgi:uncharacterized repeat protein (TIGR03803 family)
MLLTLLLVVLGVALTVTQTAAAQTFTTLHHWNLTAPSGAPVVDSAGNVYGTTPTGGKFNMGTVWELVPQLNGTWKLHGLWSFAGGAKGYGPIGLIQDAAGNLYGATAGDGSKGYGAVVFKMTLVNSKWTLHILAQLTGYPPDGPLAMDANGNLYGVTPTTGGNCCGAVWELPAGTKTPVTVYAFKVDGDGNFPVGGVTLDAQGNIYGVTAQGGAYTYGTVYEITQGVERVLYSFSGPDGKEPEARPVIAADGTLVGTARLGGSFYVGVVWEISPGGGENTVHNFQGGNDGARPSAEMIQDAQGNLYGTTEAGGGRRGTIYKVTPDGTESVLYAFGKFGPSPNYGSLAMDSKGRLYGFTFFLNNKNGTAFLYTPPK